MLDGFKPVLRFVVPAPCLLLILRVSRDGRGIICQNGLVLDCGASVGKKVLLQRLIAPHMNEQTVVDIFGDAACIW